MSLRILDPSSRKLLVCLFLLALNCFYQQKNEFQGQFGLLIPGKVLLAQSYKALQRHMFYVIKSEHRNGLVLISGLFARMSSRGFCGFRGSRRFRPEMLGVTAF